MLISTPKYKHSYTGIELLKAVVVENTISFDDDVMVELFKLTSQNFELPKTETYKVPFYINIKGIFAVEAESKEMANEVAKGEMGEMLNTFSEKAPDNVSVELCNFSNA